MCVHTHTENFVLAGHVIRDSLDNKFYIFIPKNAHPTLRGLPPSLRLTLFDKDPKQGSMCFVKVFVKMN